MHDLRKRAPKYNIIKENKLKRVKKPIIPIRGSNRKNNVFDQNTS